MLNAICRGQKRPVCKHKAQTNIVYFEVIIESVYKNARTTSLRFLEQTTRTTSSAANDYAPSSSCADDDMLLVLMIATAHSMLVSTTNQKRAGFFFSEDRRSRRRPGCNRDGCQTGIEPGTCS